MCVSTLGSHAAGIVYPLLVLATRGPGQAGLVLAQLVFANWEYTDNSLRQKAMRATTHTIKRWLL